MNKKEIEYKILELKDDYVRLQNDLEKRESVSGDISPLERQLVDIEKELSILNKKLLEI